MQYTREITVNKDIQTVWSKFIDKDFQFKWFKQLKEINQIKGKYKNLDSEAELVFDFGGQEMKMNEQVVKREDNKMLVVLYDMPDMKHTLEVRFEKIEDKTKCSVKNTFEFKSFKMKLMSWFMGGQFKKQSEDNLTDFKNAIEN